MVLRCESFAVLGRRVCNPLFLLTEPSSFEFAPHFWRQILCFVDGALIVALVTCGFGAGNGCELVACAVEDLLRGCYREVSVAVSAALMVVVVFKHPEGVAESAFDNVLRVACYRGKG
jgi:hypothetical protein